MGETMKPREIYIIGLIIVIISLLFYISAYFKQLEIDENIDEILNRQIDDEFTFEDYSRRLNKLTVQGREVRDSIYWCIALFIIGFLLILVGIFEKINEIEEKMERKKPEEKDKKIDSEFRYSYRHLSVEERKKKLNGLGKVE